MNDETTEKLRVAARNIQGNLGRCLYRRKDIDEMQEVCDLLFEAADTIESMGNGTLTAEQVRDAVLENFEEMHETRYDHWEPSKFDWQAITDELNAELGSGKCEPDEDGYCPYCGEDLVRCDVGIGEGGGAVELDPPVYYNYCPNCGARIRKAVTR